VGTDYAELTIQKFNGQVFDPPVLTVDKDADTYVHAYFRTASDGAAGIEQVTTAERTVAVSRTLPVPGGDVTFRNGDGLWPTGLLCPTPSSCAPMTRTIRLAGDGALTLHLADGLGSTSGTLTPTRYDQIVAASSGFDLHLVHQRVPFVPPGAPTIDALPAQAPITVAYGVRTLALTGIGSGTPGERQGLRLSATSSNPDVVPVPELRYTDGGDTATLRYHGVAPGTATITVVVTDDGGTPGYPADDQATSVGFAVSVLPARTCMEAACPVYVTQRDQNLIEVVDALGNTVGDNLRGGYPLALSADGQRLYTVIRSDLLVVATATHEVRASLPLPGPANAMAQSPSGDRLYLTIPAQTSDAHDLLAVVDPATGTVSSFDLGRNSFAENIAASLDGRRLYVTTGRAGTNPNAGELLTVAAPSLQVLGATPIDAGPHHLAVTPAGDRVFVVSHDANNVAVVDTAQGSVIGRIPTGRLPEGIALTPDGKLALVGVFASAFNGRIDTIDTATLALVRSTTLDGLNGPKEIAITPDGTRAYISFETDRALAVMAPLTGRVTQTIPIGTPTIGVVLAPLPLLPVTIGDVTHDQVVDRRDIDLLRADLNEPVASARCGLACDLDADGRITVLDARRMVTLCSASRCALP
jgi:YVTN family beta-propeller protein